MDVFRLSAAAAVVLSGRDALSVVNERHVDNFDVLGVKIDQNVQSPVLATSRFARSYSVSLLTPRITDQTTVSRPISSVTRMARPTFPREASKAMADSSAMPSQNTVGNSTTN